MCARDSAQRQSSPQMEQDIADWKNAESCGESASEHGEAISHRGPNVLPCRITGKLHALMTVRIRIFITALLLCHFLVCCSLVTSQLRPAQPVQSEEVTISAASQEKVGSIYNLRGDV